jgi:hypothetical protein
MSDKVELLKQLYGRPLVSSCCQGKVFMSHGEGNAGVYICKRCQRDCEAIYRLPISDCQKTQIV